MNLTTTAAPPAVRLPFQFDAAQLLADLARVQPNEWLGHYNHKEYEGDWSIAPLRSVGGHPAVIHAVPLQADANVYRDTPLLQRCPHFQAVLAQIECPLGAVRLMSLAPGARILEHSDHLEPNEARLHVPIVTNSGVEFYIGGQRWPMQPGELWYGDFSQPHHVENKGDSTRIHLVVDCLFNEWLEGMLY